MTTQTFECYKCEDTKNIKMFSRWEKGVVEEEPNAICKDCVLETKTWDKLLFEIRNPWTANTMGQQEGSDGVIFRIICTPDGIINTIRCY